MSYRIIVFLISFYIIIPNQCFSGIDTTRIGRFSTNLLIKPIIINTGLNISMRPRESKISTFDKSVTTNIRTNYNAYIPTYTGVAFSLYGLGFSFALGSNSTYINKNEWVATDVTDIRLNFYRTWIGYEAYFQNYNSLYRNEITGNPFTGGVGNNSIYSASTNFINSGINLYLIPNFYRYSYNAAFNNTEFQKKSASSFIYLNMLNFQSLADKEGLIPLNQQLNYEEFGFLKYNTAFSYAFLPGYAFTLVAGKAYFSLLSTIGAGFMAQRFKTFSTKSNLDITFNSRSRASVGFNSKYFFTGVYASYDYMQYSLKKIQFRRNDYTIGAYLGFRLIKLKKEKIKVVK
ncbi:MAG: DUF4421 family protein [Bacteroidia bacterium]